MRHPILTLHLANASLVEVRERNRELAALLGFDPLQRTRWVGAMSELAQLAMQVPGEATLAVLLDTDSPHCRCATLVAQLAHTAPAVPGIGGVRHLVDHLRMGSPGDAVASLEMLLPRGRELPPLDELDAQVAALLQREPHSAAQEVEQQHRETLQALEELRSRQLAMQQSELRKNEFLALLAHELRNPLATMNMTLAILRRKADITAQEIAKRSEVMTRQVVHLVRLVDDLTTVTRAERAGELHEVPVEMNSLVRDALEIASGPLQQRRQALVFKPAPDAVWVAGNSAALLQVVGNVVRNAIKYTPEEGSIEVRVRTEGAEAVIEVADNGVGIGADLLPQVFGMFVQGGGRSTDAGAGLGVGLTVAQRLARQHGGSIAARSEGLGRGSEFAITLPLLAADA
jgi:signal transduction histidine kinase